MLPVSLRAILALSFFATCAPAQNLAASISTLTGAPAVSRANWGIMVTTLDGAPIYSLNEGKLFQPASNAKLFTTAAALALLRTNTFETKVVGEGHFTGTESLVGDLVLIGDGDANLSGRAIPYAPPSPIKIDSAPALRYLEEMTDTVTKSGLKTINGDIVGDDTLFPWEPYPIDWSQDDLVWGYGAPVSALTITDNQLKVTVTPGLAGTPPTITLDPAVPYYTLDTTGLTTAPAKSPSHIEFDRAPGSKLVRIYGNIAADAQPDIEEIAIADPAEYAAVALKSMLDARGITITGVARAEHRMPTLTGSFQSVAHAPVKGLDLSGGTHVSRGPRQAVFADCGGCDSRTIPENRLLATHTSFPVGQDVTITNKVSQNLHAELLLHQLGTAVLNDGSTAQGVRVVRQFAIQAGVDPDDFIFYDGSGLSGHDLVTPRAIAKLLQFATKQSWFADYKASLPIGGIDGSLEHRFTAAPLKGHVFAKTGTLGEARALSGYLDCASGRTVIFSILVGNHDPTSSADRDVMDKIVAAIAAAE